MLWLLLLLLLLLLLAVHCCWWLQGALSFLGPMMWAWLAVDLVKAALGTDYARVVRAVYVLAQVSLELQVEVVVVVDAL